MKRTLKLLFSTVLLSAVLFAGCSFGQDKPENNNGNNENQGKVETVQVLKFKRDGAKALAVVEQTSTNGNVASARNATTDSMIQKILEDGTMESFIEVPEGYSLSTVKYIAQSSNPNSKEIYIVLNGRSWGGYWDEEQDKYIECNLGTLLCVFEDGKYDDVLNEGPGEWKDLYSGGDNQSIVFDKNGTMYYLVNEWSNGMNTGMIYKYDAATKTSIQLTPAVTGTYYEKVQVSADGKWLFAKAYKWSRNSSTTYLRAIPVDNPKDYKNIFYNANGGAWIRDWYYDDDNNELFYSKNSSLYELAEKDGVFSSDNEKELFSGGDGIYFHYGHIMDWTSGYSRVIRDEVYVDIAYDSKQYLLKDTDGNLNGEALYEALLFSLVNNVKTKPDTSDRDNYISEVKDTYHISFKKFADVPGYELLATETKDLWDKDLFEAFAAKDLEMMFCKLLRDDRYSSNYRYNWYDHNFTADVLYKKVTENGEIKYVPLTMADFDTIEHGYMSNVKTKYEGSGFPANITEEDYVYTYSWNSNYSKKVDEETVVDAEAVLAYFASFCTTNDIDFKLTYFKDDPEYGSLYTEEINEKAIEYLDDPVNMQLLARYLDNHYSAGICHAGFFKYTCFIAGTDEPAYVEPETSETDSSSSSIWWGGVANFVSSYGKSLYGIQDSSYSEGSSLIQILDADGKKTGKRVDILKNYKISKTVGSDNGFYFQVALTNKTGQELGKHKIYYYDNVNNEIKNLFANVENNENLEVISYSAGGDYLYFCAVEGLNVISEKINVKDLTATKLASGTKLSQIMTMN